LARRCGAGEDIGIVRGSDIVALRKVEVESTGYAQRGMALCLSRWQPWRKRSSIAIGV
jgi:hypothetical protein